MARIWTSASERRSLSESADAPLPQRFRDHALVGQWRNCRDCHIRPDLILIYRKPDDESLDLIRLGSHSDLGF